MKNGKQRCLKDKIGDSITKKEDNIVFGNHIKCRYPYSYNSIGYQLDNAINSIQLTQQHEAGELINKYWLILNPTVYTCKDDIQTIFDIGEYVSVIDIRYFDIFESDMNYDDRLDLKKLGTRTEHFWSKIFKVNIYSYIGTDFPKEMRLY